MLAPSTQPTEPLLPHLLSLPPGIVAGIAPGISPPDLGRELAFFGPSVQTEHELRYAVHRAPARLVVEAGLPPPLVGAALAALRQGGTVVVLRSEDWGRLLDWCERVLVATGAGWRWRAPRDLRADRCLMLRVAEGADWLRIPLAGGAGAEAVLADMASAGIRVRESRIAYPALGAR